MNDLPELPKEFVYFQPPYPEFGYYNTERMRAYGIACWNAAIEAAARAYEGKFCGLPDGASEVGRAIRALTKGTT